MRIALLNSDTMGDVILREPMFRALAAAGHELMILAQAQFHPLMRCLAPTATIADLPNDFKGNGAAELAIDDAGSIAKTIADWRPDLMVFAAWHWSKLEEHIAGELPEVPVVGFEARRIDANSHDVVAVRFAQQVTAGIDLTEIEKNRRMAAQLGVTVDSGDLPTMAAGAAALESAGKVLQRAKLPVGGYWLGAVGEGSTRYKQLRNWRLEKWAEALRHAVVRHGWRFLLSGSPDERDSSRRIRDLADVGDRIVVLEEATDLETLIGLTASARGYVGRDTGPMHLAAALDRPVLALFGGGGWPRFVPSARTAVVLTVDVPCKGCAWACHYSASFCIKEIPVAAVTAAIDDLAAGTVAGVDVRDLPVPRTLARTMENELAARMHLAEKNRFNAELQVESLLDSRWRKIGLKLGVVKKIEWEPTRTDGVARAG
jgi:ADP-heptose:LPS heptosyltransferase